MEKTYRLIALSDSGYAGKTAASPELAKLVPGDLRDLEDERFGIEMTEWVDNYGKMQVNRKVLIEAEDKPGQWKIGV
jgi:hypothetical protein